MRKKTVVVHCTFDQNGKSLTELLHESFQLYLTHALALSPEKPACARKDRPPAPGGR